MDFSYSAFFDPTFDWNNSEGTPFEFSTDHYNDDAQSAAEINLEGTPSESSRGPDISAIFGTGLFLDPNFGLDTSTYHSSDATLYAPENDSEGTPSEFSFAHISNAPSKPSSEEELLSDTDIGDDSNSSIEESDADHLITASAIAFKEPDPTNIFSEPSRPPPKTTPTSRGDGSHHVSGVISSFAAYAAALRTPNRPVGTPSGAVHHSLQPGMEQEGTPSSSKPRSLASATSQPPETDSTTERELQLERLLTLLAKAKRVDALLHVAAADSSVQLISLIRKGLVFKIATDDAREWVAQAEAAEDAWLKHLAALARSDRDASATARRRYDRFCTEHGLHANLERAKELLAMLEAFDQQVVAHKRRLLALPEKQKNAAFTVVKKMPPVKLYKLPGTPGNIGPSGSKSDKAVHGTPCTPPSRPTTASGLSSARCKNSPPPDAPKPSPPNQPAAGASRRSYCVFCTCHDHWSSDCPSNDFQARWSFVTKLQLCLQCLRAGHHPADCCHATRRCLHCAARHHAALCAKAHGPAFQPAGALPTLGSGHASAATAAAACPGIGMSSAPTEHHDDRFTTAKPLDTKPRSSPSTQPPNVSPAAAGVEPSQEHSLASAITSFFQRNSAGSDVVVGFYARTQDNAGRTFYQILKPLTTSFPPEGHRHGSRWAREQTPSLHPNPVDDLDDHLQVDHVIMLQTIAHILPRDSLPSPTALPDADSHHSTRRSIHPSESSSCSVLSTTSGVVATVLSDVAPRQVTLVSELATAMRTPPLPRQDALSPTTTDSAPTEVEPEAPGTTSRHSRRQRRPRRKQCSQLCRTLPKKSIAALMTESPVASIATANSTDHTQSPVALSEAGGTPLVALECHGDIGVEPLTPPTPAPPISDRQLPSKRVRTWTASTRKTPLPNFSPPTTSIANPHNTEANQTSPRTCIESAAAYLLKVDKVSTELRVNLADCQRTTTVQPAITANDHDLPSPLIPSIEPPMAQDDGASAASATLGQLSAAATAAAAPATAPATPDPAVHATGAAPVLTFDSRPWSEDDVALLFQVVPLVLDDPGEATPATEHDESKLDAADAEGTPSVDAVPPSAQYATCPEPSAALTVLQPQINLQTLALLFPQASPELLGMLWDNYQKPAPSSDADTDSALEANPIFGHPSVATAAGGRSPSDQAADNPRNPGQGHSSGATAAGDRSPPDTSDTIRTRTSSTEQRRGTPRASSRGPAVPRAHDQPRLGEGRRGH